MARLLSAVLLLVLSRSCMATQTIYYAKLASDSSTQPNAGGDCTVTIDPELGVGTFLLNIRNTANIIMAHMHQGPATVNGPPVVGLLPAGVPALTTLSDPVSATAGQPLSYSGVIAPGALKLAASVNARPTPYNFKALAADAMAGNLYCNVHTTDAPGGLSRGQLAVIG